MRKWIEAAGLAVLMMVLVILVLIAMEQLSQFLADFAGCDSACQIERQVERFERCIEIDQFTRAECIQLVGGE